LFPDDVQFWYETQRAFGAAEYGGSLFGEVLTTAGRIKAGDYDSWYNEWNAIADRLAKEAADQLARGHRVSARDNFLRASNYYWLSEFFSTATRRTRGSRAYKLSVDSYKQSAALYDQPIRPVEIPYENTTLPGYLHLVDDTGRPRPTLIMHTGFDGSAEEMHTFGARAGVERGYRADIRRAGPIWTAAPGRTGLSAGLGEGRDAGGRFRAETARRGPEEDSVDGAQHGWRVGATRGGIREASCGADRQRWCHDYADAHRAAAAVPPEKHAEFDEAPRAKDAPELDLKLEAAMKASPTARWAINHGMFATGAKSPRAYFAKTLEFNVKDGVAEKISCPTLVMEAENDLFFKGQPQLLFDHLTCRKTIMRFTNAEGAGAHCQVGASRLAFACMFDWLDETLA
jgi:hypothetical protein